MRRSVMTTALAGGVLAITAVVPVVLATAPAHAAPTVTIKQCHEGGGHTSNLVLFCIGGRYDGEPITG